MVILFFIFVRDCQYTYYQLYNSLGFDGDIHTMCSVTQRKTQTTSVISISNDFIILGASVLTDQMR